MTFSIEAEPQPWKNGWVPFPSTVCSFFKRGTCLRMHCAHFHGTEEARVLLKDSGVTLYRVHDGKIHRGAPLSTNVLKSPFKCTYVVCLEFLQGECKFPNCKYVHLKDDVRLVPAKVCSYPVCKKGSKCRLFHGSVEAHRSMIERGTTLYNPITGEPYEREMEFHEIDKRGNTRSVPFAHTPPPPWGITSIPPPPVVIPAEGSSVKPQTFFVTALMAPPHNPLILPSFNSPSPFVMMPLNQATEMSKPWSGSTSNFQFPMPTTTVSQPQQFFENSSMPMFFTMMSAAPCQVNRRSTEPFTVK